MKFFNKIKGFTLAEVMITLTIIGIISAIAIPVAIHSKPDENLIKFKKGHETLAQVINTLITSDKYFAGDLGIKADGTLITGEVGNSLYRDPYFCNATADILNVKLKNCKEGGNPAGYYWLLSHNNTVRKSVYKYTVTEETITETKNSFDDSCMYSGSARKGADIITADNISYFEYEPSITFGKIDKYNNKRIFSPPSQFPANYADENGFDIAYKIYCIDVDGIPSGGSDNCDDKKDICPFGYGIRADGKILPGARAEEWLKKDIQKKKQDEES